MPSIYSIDRSDVEHEPRDTHPRAGVETKKVLCASCDIACSVVTEVKNGRVVRVRSSDNPIFKDNIF